METERPIARVEDHVRVGVVVPHLQERGGLAKKSWRIITPALVSFLSGRIRLRTPADQCQSTAPWSRKNAFFVPRTGSIPPPTCENRTAGQQLRLGGHLRIAPSCESLHRARSQRLKPLGVGRGPEVFGDRSSIFAEDAAPTPSCASSAVRKTSPRSRSVATDILMQLPY